MYDLKFLTGETIAIRCDSRAEAVFFNELVRGWDEDISNLSGYFSDHYCCFNIEDGEMSYDSESAYRDDGYEIIPFREFFVSLCGGVFDLSLFARKKVAIQADTREEELYLIEAYNCEVSNPGSPFFAWKPRNPNSSQIGYSSLGPTCYSFGHIDPCMGFCDRSYYERNDCVIFSVSELFDFNSFGQDDPSVDFLL